MRQCRVLVDPVTAVGTTITQVGGYLCSIVSLRFKLTLSIKYDVMSLMIVNIYRTKIINRTEIYRDRFEISALLLFALSKYEYFLETFKNLYPLHLRQILPPDL